MKRKKNKRLKPTEPRRSAPPSEQIGSFETAGMAYRRVPVIDTMLARGQLCDDEHRRLRHYRDQEALAGASPVRSCLDVGVGGGGGDIPMTAAVLSAQLAVARIEKDLGSLSDIARAVAIDDLSLSQWCCRKHGSRERYDARGRFVAIVPVAESRVVPIAKTELRMAARRILA